MKRDYIPAAAIGAALLAGGGIYYIMKKEYGLIPGDPSSMSRFDFIAKLKQQVGKPYIWGAAGPDAFDCSGLVQYCYGLIGISTPRLVTEQAAEAPNQKIFTTYKTPGELEPVMKAGDCLGIDYSPGGRFDHVIVYIGKGRYIQATGGESCPNHPTARCKVVEDTTDRFQSANVRAVYSYAESEKD